MLKTMEQNNPKKERANLKTLLFAVFLLFCTLAYAEMQASWYSVESLKQEGTWAYSNGIMANGKQFHDYGLTCASCDYPLGTMLHVINTQNNKGVYVIVTDRTNKRFKGKRIDLSKRAFEEIADLKKGLISVIIEVIE